MLNEYANKAEFLLREPIDRAVDTRLQVARAQVFATLAVAAEISALNRFYRALAEEVDDAGWIGDE